jgi:hypothetical protein
MHTRERLKTKEATRATAPRCEKRESRKTQGAHETMACQVRSNELIVDCDRHLTIVDCVLTIGSS